MYLDMIKQQATELTHVLNVLRKNKKQIHPSDIIGRLKSICGNHIRVRHNVQGTNCTSNKFAALKATSGLVILTAERFSAPFSVPLTSQCNGLVLDYPSWDVLAVPPKMLNPKCKLSAALNSNPTIYKIYDGTTVTLYFHSGEWRLATTNGFDVNNYKWAGNKTYLELFSEVAAEHPKFSLEKLDTGKSYSVGFRHPEIHPLNRDPAGMWFIQSCDLRALNCQNPKLVISTDEDIGLPLQETLKCEHSGRALLNYMNDVNSKALDDYIVTGRIHYGYVLRSSTGSDTALESELYKAVKNLMYNTPKKQTTLTADTRYHYMALSAYIGPRKSTFIALFPQYADEFARFDAYFDKLSCDVTAIIRLKGKSSNVLPNKTTWYLADSISHKVGAISSTDDQTVKELLRDYRNIEIYFSALFNVS